MSKIIEHEVDPNTYKAIENRQCSYIAVADTEHADTEAGDMLVIHQTVSGARDGNWLCGNVTVNEHIAANNLRIVSFNGFHKHAAA